MEKIFLIYNRFVKSSKIGGNMEYKVIGIEGLVGSGKTSICRELLNQIPNSILMNGSNFYRAIVMVARQHNLSSIDTRNIDIKAVMDLFGIEIKIENRETVFYQNGIKLQETDLQSKEASLDVSKIGGSANNQHLFEFARELIQKLKQNHTIILSGRKLLEIYPKIDYHFFITASLEERVNRKCTQYNDKASREEVEQNIVRRDALQEKAGFYQISPKTIVLDVTNCETVEESTKMVLEQIYSKNNIM